MKNEYAIPSDRYHHLHKFVKKENGHYDFVPQEDWMPVYVTMKEDGSGVEFIDTDGGPFISEGFKTFEITVEKIVADADGQIEFILTENEGSSI